MLQSIITYLFPFYCIAPNSQYIEYSGRFDTSNPSEYVSSYPATSFSIYSNATKVWVTLHDYPLDNAHSNYIYVIVDGKILSLIQLQAGEKEYLIFSSDVKKYRTIEIFKRTESLVGNIGVKGFRLSRFSQLKQVPQKQSKKILFIGNSLTCGYGNEALKAEEPFSAKTENAYMSYASIAARELQMSYQLVSYSGKGICRNWADTVYDKETMPMLFERTLALSPEKNWDHSLFVPDIIAVNLGTNDFSPPIQLSKDIYVARYISFIQRLQTLYPNAYIICIVGQSLEKPQREIQKEWILHIISQMANSKITLFELSQQGGVGFGADWHPNLAQHTINAQELVQYITNFIIK